MAGKSAFLIVVVFLLGLAGCTSAGVPTEYDAGLKAYQAGDYVAAIDAWQPLAESGDAEAQYALGYIYQSGDGVSADSAEAAKWFKLAAEQYFPPAMYLLGRLYARGEGVPKDLSVSTSWIKQAASLGSDVAQNALGQAYLNGFGLPVDRHRALDWFRLAADQGNRQAMNNISFMYYNGYVAGYAAYSPSSIREYRQWGHNAESVPAESELERLAPK